jgi:hypothetical protein
MERKSDGPAHERRTPTTVTEVLADGGAIRILRECRAKA